MQRPAQHKTAVLLYNVSTVERYVGMEIRRDSICVCVPPYRGLLCGLSAAGFAGMAAAALAFVYLDKVIAQQQVYFTVQRHGYPHIGESGF